MSIETNDSSGETSSDRLNSNHHHRPSVYRGRNRLALSNEGPYFFRSLVWGIYKTGQYSDFTIRVKGSMREFHVHRAVICPQSGIFEAACRGQFIEASTNSITLSDDEPEIVERMIRYLYTHRYDDAEDWNHECCDNGIKRIRQHYETVTDGVDDDEDEDYMGHSFWSSRRLLHEREAASPTDVAETVSHRSKLRDNNKKAIPSPCEPPKSLYVYAIADKYLVYPLKDLARTRFSNWVYSHWWTLGFVAAAREIFDNDTGNYNELKEVILSTIVLHADTLLCGGSGSKNGGGDGEIDKFMQDYNEVSVEVLRRTLDRTRIRQRGLEVDIADLESRVNALKFENKRIGILQTRNNSLNKELLEVKMVVLAWKRDLKNFNAQSTSNSRGSSAGQDRREGGHGTTALSR